MGHVEKRGTKGGAARWVAVWADPDGKRRSKSFGRKLDADRHVAQQTVDVLSGSWVDPRAGRVTVGNYARQWVAERPIRPSTRDRYAGYLAHLAELDGIALGDLRPSTVRTWQTGLAARLAPSTARTVRGVLAAILKSAVVDRLIASSPVDGVKAPAKPARVLVQPYPADRVVALRDAITPRLAAAIMVGAGVGLRRGEAMGLTVDRVDFLRRTITVDRQLVGADNGAPVFGPPKTAASVRVVPVPGAVLDALAAHLAEFGPGPAGLLFTAPRGGPVTRSKVGAAWLDAEVRVWARATGHELSDTGRIPAATAAAFAVAHPGGHGHRFHDLRHFYASTLIRHGESVKVVQARLGHATAAETLDTYAHLWPDDEDRTRAAIDAAFGAPHLDARRSV